MQLLPSSAISKKICRNPSGTCLRVYCWNFFIEEIGPTIYNRGVADAQTRMHQRVTDLDGELYADEFPYWPRHAKNKNRR